MKKHIKIKLDKNGNVIGFKIPKKLVCNADNTLAIFIRDLLNQLAKANVSGDTTMDAEQYKEKYKELADRFDNYVSTEVWQDEHLSVKQSCRLLGDWFRALWV